MWWLSLWLIWWVFVGFGSGESLKLGGRYRGKFFGDKIILEGWWLLLFLGKIFLGNNG